MSKNITPLARQYTPQQVEAAKAQAEKRAAELHEAGKHEGLRLAQRYRDVAMVALGFIAGSLIGGWAMQETSRAGVLTAGAVADRVLQRTVNANDPFEGLNSIPAPRSYAPEPGCLAGALSVPGRRCPPEPADAPRR